MNNKAHTILVSTVATYGTRLTFSSANCKAFLADFLTDHPEEKTVLVALHKHQLTNTLRTYQIHSIDKKALIEYIEKLKAKIDIATHDLAWGVDAWANALGIDVKSRRMIRKQCFTTSTRELHLVTVRAAEVITEETPEVPPVVIDNANQAALPRIAFLGVATLVSTFSLFQAFKTMLTSDTPPAPANIEQAVSIEKELDLQQNPLPKLVVIKPRETQIITETSYKRLSQTPNTIKEQENIIDIDKLSGKEIAEPKTVEPAETAIEFAAVDAQKPLPETESEQTTQTPASDVLHADIEAFLTQD